MEEGAAKGLTPNGRPIEASKRDKRRKAETKKKLRKKKMDKHEVDELMLSISEVVRRGKWSYAFCVQMARRYKLSTDQIYAYRKKVIELWKELYGSGDIEADRAEFFERIRSLQEEAREAKQYTAANAAMKLEAEILGLNAPKVVEHRLSGHDGGPIQVQQIVATITQQITDKMTDMGTHQLEAIVEGTYDVDGLVEQVAGQLLSGPANGNNGSGPK